MDGRGALEPRLMRRDFVPVDTLCARLSSDGKNHAVRSGKAWIIEVNGVERPYGPNCAAEILGDAFAAAKSIVPDLTRHDLMKLDEPGHEGGCGGGGGRRGRGEESHDKEQQRHALAAAYLVLRGAALATVRGVNPGVNNYGALVDLYSRYRANHSLTADEVEAVLRIEAAAEARAYVFSRKNLMTVYAAHHQLLRKRKEAERDLDKMMERIWADRTAYNMRLERLKEHASRIDSVNSQLLKKLYISTAQIKMTGLELPTGSFPPNKCRPIDCSFSPLDDL